MPVERSKKTINAWAKFLATPEGQEGIQWLHDQRPRTVISDGVHVMQYSAGQVDWHHKLLDIITDELPVPPEPKKQDEEPGLIPRD